MFMSCLGSLFWALLIGGALEALLQALCRYISAGLKAFSKQWLVLPGSILAFDVFMEGSREFAQAFYRASRVYRICLWMGL